MRLLATCLAACALLPLAAAQPAPASEPLGTPVFSRFAAGPGPAYREDARLQLVRPHADGSSGAQRNSAAWADDAPASERVRVRGVLRADSGVLGGYVALLDRRKHGSRGPAPFLATAEAPSLPGSFAVGIDVHNPPNAEPFGPWGNYQKLPEREISLHFDGRELVKRVAPVEFRGKDAAFEIIVQHVVGGAEVTVVIAGGKVYDRHFIAHLHPYPCRLAVGGADGGPGDKPEGGRFELADLAIERGPRAKPRRPPVHVEVFNHKLTHAKATFYDREVELPPAAWSFGRVIMTIEIHDAGKDWDEWDRNAEVSIWRGDKLMGIVPFITSYRTECFWQVDVTHFRPWLAGKVKLRIAGGTTFYKNRGYMMSLALDFHHGAQALEPFAVHPVWVGTAAYKSADNHFQDFYTPRTIEIPQGTAGARLFTTTTGHSQIGEFTPSRRILTAKGKGEPRRFPQTIWKTDCYLNPNRPQYGTWKYSRAGWAPGDVVHPWIVDLGALIEPGKPLALSCEPLPYDFSRARNKPKDGQINAARHVVRSYLILYRKPGQLAPAPTLRIGSVDKDSAAAKAGIKAGDWLASYAGKRIDSIDDLRAAIMDSIKRKQATVPVSVYRGVEKIELEIAPGRMGIRLGR